MKNSESALRSGAVVELAASQQGMLSLEQLISMGMWPSQISRAVRAGLLRRVGPSLYELKASDKRWERALRFAALWIPDGVFSHETAAVLHELEGVNAAPVEISVPTWRKSRRGIKLHEALVPPEDRVVLKGLPVTSVNRTLMDLAAVVEEENLAFAVEYAWRKGLTNPFELRLRFEERRTRGVKGVEQLHRVLCDCESRIRPFDSGLEVRMWRILRSNRLHPDPQLTVYDDEGELRIDFPFVYERVALETMGAKWHEGLPNLERDSARSLRLSALGWTVVPVTWKMLDEDRAGVIRKIKDALRTHDPRNTRDACVAGQLGFPSDYLLFPAPQVARWRKRHARSAA